MSDADKPAPVPPRSLDCAACLAVEAILSRGRGFERFDDWRARLFAMPDAGVGVPSPLRAAQLLRLGVVDLLRDGDCDAARRAFGDAIRLVADGPSTALLLALRALAGIADCLAGRLVRADVQLSDAALFCRDDGHATLARALLQSALDLHRLMSRDAQGARLVLERPGVGLAPDGLAGVLRLLQGCLRLYAAAVLGLGDQVQALSNRLALDAVGARRTLLHAARHLVLGVAALRQGEALRALVHAEEGRDAGERAGARLVALWAVLLQVQALADLGRADEARDLVARWSQDWRRLGLRGLAAAAQLELAMLDARAGELDRARHASATARECLPSGETMRALHRPGQWWEELQRRLVGLPAHEGARAHVQIRTLGAFVVEINGRCLYDRDWKGQRSRSLLIALICEGGRKVAADRLADRLWPDSDGAQARQNLKVALHRLRRLGCAEGASPVNWIHVKQGQVSLCASLCWVDAHEFCAVAATDPGRAQQLYGGDFLPAEDGLPWVLAYRARLARLLACATGPRAAGAGPGP